MVWRQRISDVFFRSLVLGRRLFTVSGITWKRFCEVEAGEASAAIAFYALFSMFPLILLLTHFCSFVLQNPGNQQEVLTFIEQFLPNSQHLIRENLPQILNQNGEGTLFGTVILLWASTGVFAGIAQNINQAWHCSEPRHFLVDRSIGILIIVGLSALLIGSIIVTTAIQFFLKFPPIALEMFLPLQSYAGYFLLRLVPIAFIFSLFLFLYKWVPNTRVLWTEAAWGALFATISGEFTKSIFVWYISSRLPAYQLLYGSLGLVVALMLWIYVFSFIVLLGCNLSAAIASENRLSGKAENDFKLDPPKIP
ncbi:MAG: YihY/virulence factor BrkB family protein [Candidatus Ozemobacteraceae bacterium]